MSMAKTKTRFDLQSQMRATSGEQDRKTRQEDRKTGQEGRTIVQRYKSSIRKPESKKAGLESK